MICGHCGAQNPEGNRFCQYCNSPLAKMAAGGNAGSQAYAGPDRGGYTLFHALSYQKTMGTNVMLGVFISLCVSVFFSILALAVRKHVSYGGAVINISTSTWVFLLLFQIAMAILLVFRQDLINIIVGTFGIEGISTILLYSLFAHYFGFGVGYFEGPVVMIIIFMVFLILGVLVKLVFVCISAFTGRSFGNFLFILSVSYSGTALLFGMITLIVVGSSGDEFAGLSRLSEYCGIGFGFSAYVIAIVATGVISFCFYRGLLGTRTNFAVHGNYGMWPVTSQPDASQSWQMSGQLAYQQGAPGLQCIVGAGQGKVIPLQGEIVLGSEQGQVNVLVNVQGVSRQHCQIRFEASQNCYYVRDLSRNGTYVNNQRISADTYTACGRGSIVALASQEQQYKLL